MIKTTRIKYSQSPRIIVDDLSPQCDGVTQVFKLSQPIPEWAPYCLVFNGQLYTNTSYKEWFTLDSDRQTIRTSFITPPTPGINKSLILIVGVAGMEDLGVDWADITNKPDLAMETDLETETAAREAADTAIRESIPTKTSDITNDSDFVSDANYVHTDNNFTSTLKNKLNGIQSGAEANVQSDWSQNTTTADDFIKNKPTIGDATLTIQKNGSNVGTFTANATSNKSINIDIPTSAADVSALPASTKYGSSFVMTVNTTDYKVTATLKDQDGNTLGTSQVIDLPIESVVVGGSYDSTNKKIILTLQNGTTINIPVADLVSGLQSEITSSNKLASDLVDDSNSSHKFTTAANLSKLAGIAAGAEVNVQANWTQTTTTADDYIKNKPNLAAVATSGSYNDLTNKPTIPSGQIQSDWTQTNNAEVDYIKNKPNLATVATSGSYNDLSNKPTIPTVNNATLTITQNGTSVGTFTANASSNKTIAVTDTTYSDATTSASGLMSSTDKTKLDGIATGAEVNVQSDWNQATTTADDYIKNKPDVPVITMTSTDPGEGGTLAANNFIGVYQ